MNKLKPILAQQFWILIVVALILPIVGWYPTTADMVAKFDARSKAIEDTWKAVPTGSSRPNDNWTRPVNDANAAEEKSFVKTQHLMWTHQWDFTVKLGDQKLQLLTWPENVAKDIPNVYRGEIEYTQRTAYKESYDDEIIKTWEMIKPFDSDVEGEKLVDCPLEVIRNDGWRENYDPPKADQMWDSQEDIWLYRMLFYSIAALNESEGATNRNDAPIRRILRMDLRGGNKTKAGSAATASTAGGTQKAAPAASAKVLATTLGPPPTNAGFSSNDEFGPEDEPLGATGAPKTAGPPGAAGATGAAAANKPAAPAPSRATTPGQSAATKKRRYMDEQKEFKTRAFYMELEMDHRKLPEFLVQLSNSPWPLCISRVQQVGLESQDKDLRPVGGATGQPQPGAPAVGAPLVFQPQDGDDEPSSDDVGGGFGRLGRRMGGGAIMDRPIAAPAGPAGAKGLTTNPKSPWLAHVVVSGYFALYMAPNDQSTTDERTERPDEDQPEAEEGAAGTPEPMDESAEGAAPATAATEAAEADGMPAETEDGAMPPDSASPEPNSTEMEPSDESGANETEATPDGDRKPEKEKDAAPRDEKREGVMLRNGSDFRIAGFRQTVRSFL